MPRKTGDQINLGLHAIDNDAVDLSHESWVSCKSGLRLGELMIWSYRRTWPSQARIAMGHHVRNDI